MKITIFIISILFLSSCTPHSILTPTGPEVSPPPGYIKLCLEHPDLKSCPKEKSP